VKNYKSILTVLFVAAVLFVIGVACNQSGPSTTNSTTNTTSSPTTTNSTNSTNSSNSSTSTSAPKDISGSYDVTGTNEGGGGNYKGTLKVTDRDEVYQFSWNAGKTYDGVGVMTDNAVAVAFTEGANGEGCGVVLYRIGADGSLDGKAGYWGVNEAESEKATRTSGTGLDGEYDVSGTDPKGTDYKGKLSVKTAGSGYAFSWNGGKLTGFGIKQGDKVAVGLGGKQCGFVSYEVASDGTMNGKWGSVGTTTVGTETAKKK
jgi:hypothetical protein